MTDRRPPAAASLGLALFVVLAILAVVLKGECPACEGGRRIQMSLGPIPCETCAQRKTLPLWKAVYLRAVRR